MDSTMCSIGQTMPNSFLGSAKDTDSIKSCAMTDMFSQRPRNKRKDFYPNGIMRMPEEGAADLSNDDMNSEGESDPDSPIPMNLKDDTSFQDNGMDLTPQRHQEVDQRIKYADAVNDFAGLNGLKIPTAFTSAMDFQQQQQQLQYHLQQLQQQTQENQRQFQQQIQQQIEHQQLQMKQQQQHNIPLNIKTEPGLMAPNGLNLSSPTSAPINGFPMHPTAPPQNSPQNHQKLPQNNNISNGGNIMGGDIPIDFSTNTAQVKQEKIDAQDTPLEMRSPYGAYQNGAVPTDIHPNDLTNEYMCRHCRRPFKSQINLDRHMEKAHNPKNSKIFTCLLCPYTTKFYSNMYVHIRTHTGDKPYWCGACGASFSQGSSLKIHIISKHGGNKKYFILDRKLGKANLLRFWQRRDSGSHANDDRDIKPDINALNAMMSGDMANKGLIHNNNTDSVDGHMPNPNMNPAFMGAQNQLGSFGMLPNSMNMLNPMMNPLGLNLLTPNPLTAPNLMMGGMNLNGMNGNMFMPPQGLLNGLNLKNSAFFTKTTKFDLEHVRNNENKPPLNKQPIINGNSNENKNILNNLNVHPDNSLIPNMNAILQGQAKLGLDIPDFSRKFSNNNQQPQQLSSPPSEPENLSVSHTSPVSSRHNTPSPSPKQNSVCSPKSVQLRTTTPSPSHLQNELHQQQTHQGSQLESTPTTAAMTVSPNSVSTGSLHHNHSHNTSTSSDASHDSKKSGASTGPSDDCPYEQKLKDLRKNVVRMLHMMLPDLPMDKEMNRESEDVDLMLMDVIRSTVTDIGE